MHTRPPPRCIGGFLRFLGRLRYTPSWVATHLRPRRTLTSLTKKSTAPGMPPSSHRRIRQPRTLAKRLIRHISSTMLRLQHPLRAPPIRLRRATRYHTRPYRPDTLHIDMQLPRRPRAKRTMKSTHTLGHSPSPYSISLHRPLFLLTIFNIRTLKDMHSQLQQPASSALSNASQ